MQSLWNDFYLNVELVHPNAVYPTRAYSGDAGLDVYAIENITIPPRSFVRISLGLRVEFPDNFVILVADKSSKVMQLEIENVAGVIDSGYRGIVHAILTSNNDKEVEISRGEKIAQFIVVPCWTGQPTLVTSITENTDRGAKGFGSSG
jgi:dUTP pyrophosphatase